MTEQPTTAHLDHEPDDHSRSARNPFRVASLSVAIALTAAACASTTSASSSEPGVLPPPVGSVPVADPVDPIEPVAPADPSDAADPADPAEPVDPAPRDDADDDTLADGRPVVRGDVTIPTDAGEVELEDANIAIGVGPDGAPTVAGTARVPFPNEGVFADARINQLPIGEIGSAYGRDLAHLGAHLNDDTRYLFFAFDGGLDVDLPFAGREGFEALPAKIQVPAGVDATLVLDPADPYVYVGTDCPDLSDDADDTDPDQNDTDEPDTRRDDDADREDRQDEQQERDSGEAYHTIAPTDLPAGQECGIGLSVNGNIPAPATAHGEAFSGHVVVDGVVPLYAGMELDGSAVVELRDPGARTVGWGTVLATVPLIESIVDVQIPLAEASVEVRAEETRIGVAFDGSVGGQDPTYELPLIGLPITVPASGTAQWDARFGFVEQGPDTWGIDPTSYAEFSGEFGVGLASFGEAIGVELADVGTQAGSFRIDATGVTATGSTALQIHPALRSGAATEFALRIDPTDWTQTRFDLVADVQVGGYTIGAADVSIGGRGLSVAGEVDLGFIRTGVRGVIDADGFELTGTAAIELTFDLLGIEGSVRGEIAVRLASDGVGGSFSGERCGPTGCRDLPGASVHLGADPAVCADLGRILGERCLRL